MKVIFLLFFFSGVLSAGETCVYQVFKASFTVNQINTVKTAIHNRVDNFDQPIQLLQMVDHTPAYWIILADVSIRQLTSVKNAENAGKIIYIGSYRWDTNTGYDMSDPDFTKIREFFEVKPSTPT